VPSAERAHRMIGDLVKRLIAAGCDPAVAAEVLFEFAEKVSAESRARNAERQQRWRDRHRVTLRNVSNVTSRYENGHVKEEEDPFLEQLPKKVRKKKQALPNDFVLTEERRALARSKRGWPDQIINQVFERFCSHARANGRMQIDWDQSWLNWVTSPYQDQRNGENGNGRSGSVLATADHIATKLRESGVGDNYVLGSCDTPELDHWPRITGIRGLPKG
jgi:hypothetical protein